MLGGSRCLGLANVEPSVCLRGEWCCVGLGDESVAGSSFQFPQDTGSVVLVAGRVALGSVRKWTLSLRDNLESGVPIYGVASLFALSDRFRPVVGALIDEVASVSFLPDWSNNTRMPKNKRSPVSLISRCERVAVTELACRSVNLIEQDCSATKYVPLSKDCCCG